MLMNRLYSEGALHVGNLVFGISRHGTVATWPVSARSKRNIKKKGYNVPCKTAQNALNDWPVWAEGNYTEVFSKRIQTYEYVVPMYQNFNIQ